jgi:hypothetical protein
MDSPEDAKARKLKDPLPRRGIKTFRYGRPVNCLEESFNVIGALQPIVDHKGMLKDVHYQNGCCPRKVSRIMLVDPGIDELIA